MDLLLKTAGIALTAAFAGALLKKDSPAMALAVAAAAVAAVLLASAGAIRETVAFFSEAAEQTAVEPAVTAALFKLVGLAAVTRFAADLCDEAGMKAVAGGVEFAGSAAALYCALPVIRTVFSMINGLV